MQSVDGFFDMLKQFINGNALYPIAAAGYLLYIYQLKKKERNIAICALALLIVAVFNPVSFYILGVRLWLTAPYYRFLWLLPTIPCFTFLLYEAIRHIKLHCRIMLVCIICIGILLISISADKVKLPSNKYQISDETIEVAEQLKTLMDYNGTSSAIVLCDYHTGGEIHQYTANICLPFSSFSFGLDPALNEETIYGLMSMLTNNRDDISPVAINKILVESNIDYLVININNDISLSYMQRLHWQIVATTSAYHILQYQDPVFTTAPLLAAGLETESIEVIIPGLTEEYYFLYLSDLHIITENEELSPTELETVQSRQRWSSVSADMTAAEFWEYLPDILDSCNSDALLFGGDMIDFCSSSNVECLKQGLDRLVTPYLYVRADHDSTPYYCEGLTAETCSSLHENIDGNAEVQYMEFPELCIIGLNNNTSQISESGFAQIAEILATEKPTILLSHVPYASTLDTSLQDASKAVWQERALIWGQDCYYSPDANTQKLMDIIYADQSAIKEILCGHLHFTWDGPVTENTHEHVFSPAFEKKIGVVTVKGK